MNHTDLIKCDERLYLEKTNNGGLIPYNNSYNLLNYQNISHVFISFQWVLMHSCKNNLTMDKKNTKLFKLDYEIGLTSG